MTNSYASDSDYINWLRQELNDRNAAILKMQNTISRQDQAIRNLEGQLSNLGTTFNVVLDAFYEVNLNLLDAQKNLMRRSYHEATSGTKGKGGMYRTRFFTRRAS